MSSEVSKKQEDEWFARNEKALIRNLRMDRERREKELAEAMKVEKTRKQKELHWMKCPKCGADMVEKHVEGAYVDFCTLCEGIFMDKGELEQMMLKQKREPTTFVKKLLGIKAE